MLSLSLSPSRLVSDGGKDEYGMVWARFVPISPPTMGNGCLAWDDIKTIGQKLHEFV